MQIIKKSVLLLLTFAFIIAPTASFAANIEVNDKANGIVETRDEELLYLPVTTDSFSIDDIAGISYGMCNGSGVMTQTYGDYTDDSPVHFSASIGYGNFYPLIDGTRSDKPFLGCGYYLINLVDIPENVELTSIKAYYKEQGKALHEDDMFEYNSGKRNIMSVSLGYEECVDFDVDRLNELQVRVVDSDNYYDKRENGNMMTVTFVIEGFANGTGFTTEYTLDPIPLRASQPVSIYTKFDKLFRAV